MVLGVGCTAPAPKLTPTHDRPDPVTATQIASEPPVVTITATPSQPVWPTATLKNTETSTPTVPATPFFRAYEEVYDGAGLAWLECEVSWDFFHNWRAAEHCFGEPLPSSKDDDREIWGERVQREVQGFYDLILTIGDDFYETRHIRGNPIQYTLYKNVTLGYNPSHNICFATKPRPTKVSVFFCYFNP